ncbi:MAG: Crp/Fnr family transcriptional regulator [Alphaproteobacteria bacterium]|nr:Crp/Fnr family transcriptional regulator [Rhodospirillales bacterium]MCW9045528.1 Crp/Fnr family transcriptional regulator [Alphaproteobacteria bacterium]
MNVHLSPSELEVVRSAPLFSGLPDDSLEKIVNCGRVIDYVRGEMLFLRGDPVTRFFVLLEGWVKVYRDTPEGEQSVVAVMKPGESFAQAAIFTGKTTFPATAEIVDNARVLEIPAKEFLHLLKTENHLALNMLGALSERMLELVQHIEQLQFSSTRERLAYFLCSLTDVKEGGIELRLPYDKSLIAARLGMKPESLSRALAKLRTVGVSTSGNVITIEDMAVLRSYCQEGDEI